MPRRHRPTQNPSQRALEIAGSLTLLWLVVSGFLCWPLLLWLLQLALGPLLAANFHAPVPPAPPAPTTFLLADLLPAFVGSGALASAAWWWAVRTIRQRRAASKQLEELLALAPAEFEAWVGQRFRERGYEVQHTGAQGDHGIDLLATKTGEIAVVQCKRHRTSVVGEPVLRDLLGAMHAAQADRAYLVTTGRFTQAARAWARGKPLELWDGEALVRLGSKPAQTANAPTIVHQELPPAPRPEECNRCGAEMVVRANRRTGEEFLGCSRYPACRHTRPRTPTAATAV